MTDENKCEDENCDECGTVLEPYRELDAKFGDLLCPVCQILFRGGKKIVLLTS